MVSVRFSRIYGLNRELQYSLNQCPASPVTLLMELNFLSYQDIQVNLCTNNKRDERIEQHSCIMWSTLTVQCKYFCSSDFLAPFVCLCLNLKVSHSHWRDILIFTCCPSSPAFYLTPSLSISPHLNLVCAKTTPSPPLSPCHPPDGLEMCVRLCVEIVEP